ncbi:MAG: ion channel [Acetobacteraceae bacterium]
MPTQPTPARIVPRHRSEQILRKGLRTRWWRDLYHRTLTLRWWWFVLGSAMVYVGVNLLFALLFLLQPGSIQGAREGSFIDAFFFSVQCISTIGFGGLTPATLYANVLTTIEAMVSVAITALAAGSVFARISRPTARVMFSRHGVIGPVNGVNTLSFRLANERSSQILEADVSMTVLRFERTEEGDEFRRFHDLALVRTHTPVFALSFTVMHPIDAGSPLHGMTLDDLATSDAEFLITVTGLEETTSQTVHARYSWSAEEILWQSRFADIFTADHTGRRAIDYARFHEAESARDPNRPGNFTPDPVN